MSLVRLGPAHQGRRIEEDAGRVLLNKQSWPIVALKNRGRVQGFLGQPLRPPAPPTRSQSLEVSRRRRIILEDESEDEFVVQEVPLKNNLALPKPGSRASKQNGKKSKGQGSWVLRGDILVDRAAEQGPCPSLAAATARPRRVRNLSKGVAPEPRVHDEVGATLEVSMDTSTQRKTVPVGPLPDVSMLEDSDETLSEEDHLSFEIKRRGHDGRLPSEDNQPGRVQKVIQAFESGLIVNESPSKKWVRRARSMEANKQQDLGVNEDGQFGLNVYGSNMGNAAIGGVKRSLESVDGANTEPPIPKKQFVEETDELEKVEEASLEWPQPDK
ncbi:unnamed protein product [Linum trigynum]|uniref:Uncharacterized protein n=1 Tax=Linum trigynum TaxID=586398 RepID=A0AAV2CTC9_9ROSI